MGCKILKRVIWPWPRPFQGRFFFGRVGRAMVSQCTKFELSRFTSYEALNGGAKCRKWGGLGVFRGHSRSWAMPPFDRAHMTSYSTLIQTMCLSFTVFAGHLSKVADFDYPTCIRRPRRGWPRLNFAEIFGVRKLDYLGYRVVLFVWSYVLPF